MATIFALGVQKGGTSKSTTTGITAWLLAQEQGHKVLAVDFDSQGNLTQLLTGHDDLQVFREKTVLEAIQTQRPEEYIHRISDNLHILPADDFLSGFARWLYTQQSNKNVSLVLKETLDLVRDQYDYIFIDLPPNLGEQTINGIAAADYNIVMLQAEPFCYNALANYLEILIAAQERINPAMRVIGILTSVIDPRTGLGQGILDKARAEYSDFVFDTVIQRRARVAEFAITGIEKRTKADRTVLRMYESFIEELMARVAKFQSSDTTLENEPAKP
ncbi:ParA family protein [Alicyclobacillus sp. ALC3]|uniref:ParA family protein n=1 Tax=Alicyclobacillus sp. ALC3 TaxID=2796143 RepID=UPI0023795ED1|nr:ParA family protein [Alicyclobacillus sp. ALC3]WDL99798.1 ParA family protein [Alicyclobacillus sp. ALC3]